MSYIYSHQNFLLFLALTAILWFGYWLGRLVTREEFEAELRQAYLEQELLREVITSKRPFPSRAKRPALRLVRE